MSCCSLWPQRTRAGRQRQPGPEGTDRFIWKADCRNHIFKGFHRGHCSVIQKLNLTANIERDAWLIIHRDKEVGCQLWRAKREERGHPKKNGKTLQGSSHRIWQVWKGLVHGGLPLTWQQSKTFPKYTFLMRSEWQEPKSWIETGSSGFSGYDVPSTFPLSVLRVWHWNLHGPVRGRLCTPPPPQTYAQIGLHTHHRMQLPRPLQKEIECSTQLSNAVRNHFWQTHPLVPFERWCTWGHFCRPGFSVWGGEGQTITKSLWTILWEVTNCLQVAHGIYFLLRFILLWRWRLAQAGPTGRESSR